MKDRTVLFVVLVVTSISAAGGQSGPATDWPQWQGPDRTNLSKESGLLKDWPTGGPALVWSMTGLGSGYGSVAISGARIFVQGSNRRDSAVLALNRADGTRLWSKTLGPAGDN